MTTTQQSLFNFMVCYEPPVLFKKLTIIKFIQKSKHTNNLNSANNY